MISSLHSEPTDEVPMVLLLCSFICTGFSVLMSVVVSVVIMCLRESNRRAAEEAEQEEAELLGTMASDDDLDF